MSKILPYGSEINRNVGSSVCPYCKSRRCPDARRSNHGSPDREAVIRGHKKASRRKVKNNLKYEDIEHIIDKQTIHDFEEREKAGTVCFVGVDEI